MLTIDNLPTDLQTAIRQFQRDRANGSRSASAYFEAFSDYLQRRAHVSEVNAQRLIDNICALRMPDRPDAAPCFEEPNHDGCHTWERWH
jgi:hypothetical protein